MKDSFTALPSLNKWSRGLSATCRRQCVCPYRSFMDTASKRGNVSVFRQESRGGPAYDEPRAFSNLTENSEPIPVAETERRNSAYLEDQRHGGCFQTTHARRFSLAGSEISLSELAAPPPIDTQPNDPSEFREDREPSPSRLTERLHEISLHTIDEEANGQREQQSPTIPRFATEFITVSYLLFFSILGTLARLGMQWLTFYPNVVVSTPVLWANVGGSLIMGFLVEERKFFENFMPPGQGKDQFRKTKKTIPLFIGLTTGFCGSFTSFSSFMRDAFLAISNNLPTFADQGVPMNRNGGYSFEAVLAVLICTIGLCLGALILGAHLALMLHPRLPKMSQTFVNKFMDRLCVILGWGCWVGAVMLSIWPPDRVGGPAHQASQRQELWRGQALFAISFAPLGCLARFYASLWLNGKISAFPLGTFLVNFTATALEGIFYDLQRVKIPSVGLIGGGMTSCQIFQGLQDGFCGCLSTVSTWVLEIQGLRRSHGYIYALTTTITSLSLMIAVMGSVAWSDDWSTPVCNTGYPNKVSG
ncbi:hypothetical protein M433DRAFT_158490 [Acidomyces richmondensis BFW]|nr:MAG: hypothetical protein FE78DRAFT_87738 [Acidomyces sp. 'richmondensis']KYG41944.1 hypothetical protein M433DRAFT_158490 [Acidomyces richmondensis BFW]